MSRSLAILDTPHCEGFIQNLPAAGLFDVRHDEVGLALDATRVPRRGKTYGAALRRHQGRQALGVNLQRSATADLSDDMSLDPNGVDPDGVAF